MSMSIIVLRFLNDPIFTAVFVPHGLNLSLYKQNLAINNFVRSEKWKAQMHWEKYF